MKYGGFIVHVLFCSHLLCMDDHAPDTDTETLGLPAEIPSNLLTPPEDLAEFEAVVEFLQKLQNNKGCTDEYRKEQVQQAYQRYYLCPTFSKAGGKKILVILAEELDMDLRFSLRKAMQTLRFACQDIRAVGRSMAVIGTIGGLSVILYWLDARKSAIDGVSVTNSSSFYESQLGYLASQPCSPCTQAWVHNWSGDNYYPVPHYPAVANCSDLIEILNQSLNEISSACLNKVRPFFWIDAKNFYLVTCYRGGYLTFDRCNIDEVKGYLKDQVTSSYQFVLGFTGMLAALPATMYCTAAALDGGCGYIGKKLYQGYQYCRAKITSQLKNQAEESELSATNISSGTSKILLEEDEIEDED